MRADEKREQEQQDFLDKLWSQQWRTRMDPANGLYHLHCMVLALAEYWRKTSNGDPGQIGRLRWQTSTGDVMKQIEEFGRTPEEVAHLVYRFFERLLPEAFRNSEIQYTRQMVLEPEKLYGGKRAEDEVES